MLVEEYKHCLIKHVHIAKRCFLRAFPLVVEYFCRVIPYIPSFVMYAIRQIYVFSIHEEVFIEQAYIFQRRFAQQAKRTAYNLYFGSLVPWEVAHIIVGKCPVSWKAFAHPAHLVEGSGRRGYAST